jgi:hypothetical protein
VHDRLQMAVPNNSMVASLIADMNIADVANVYAPFEFALAEILFTRDLFISPVPGFIRMTPDQERPHIGNRVDVAINVSVERTGRRLIALDLDFERVRSHDLDDGPMPISRAWAYA